MIFNRSIPGVTPLFYIENEKILRGTGFALIQIKRIFGLTNPGIIMRSLVSIIVFLSLSFTSALPRIAAQDNKQYLKDSLRRVIVGSEGKDKLRAYTSLSYLYMADIADDLKLDTLMIIFSEIEAEAVRQGDVSQQGLVYGNKIIVFSNRQMHDEVIREAPAALDFYLANGLWNYYYQIHMQLIAAYNYLGEYEMAAEEAQKMYNVAKERGDKGGMATALYTTANIYNLQGREEDQERCLRECIGLLKGTSGYGNILTQAYAFLCISLRAQEKHDEVFRLIPDFEKAVEDFEKDSGTIQYEARANLYTALLNNYVETGDFDKAEYYLLKLQDQTFSNLSEYERHKTWAFIMQSRGEYAQALANIDSAIIAIEGERFTLNNAKKTKMEILIQTGNADEAILLFDEILDTDREIHDVEVNARFDELRTQYEVDKHIADKERNRNYFLFALGGCVLLLLLLGVASYYNRIIPRKNRNLYKQIKEQDRLEEELARTRKGYENLLKSSREGFGGQEAELPGDRSQRELVARLGEYLLQSGNLTNADMGRDDIASALGTNRNTLSEAVKAVTGTTPMEYIRRMQLEEARRMLDNHPELTIEAVAADCGFGTSSTFYRLFRKRYGISPAEYRKMAGPAD